MQNESWKEVAKYLYGENKWAEALGVESILASNNDDDSSSDTSNSPCSVLSTEEYISNFILVEDRGGDELMRLALTFIKPIVDEDLVARADRSGRQSPHRA